MRTSPEHLSQLPPCYTKPMSGRGLHEVFRSTGCRIAEDSIGARGALSVV